MALFIFFRDKKEELKGPFTEREVQEWYRKKWFESATPFYLTTTKASPSADAEFVTLEELIARNGAGAPFREMREGGESKVEQMQKRLEKLQKEIGSLRKKCAGVDEVEGRVDQMERRVKELLSAAADKSDEEERAAAAAAASSAATESEKSDEKKDLDLQWEAFREALDACVDKSEIEEKLEGSSQSQQTQAKWIVETAEIICDWIELLRTQNVKAWREKRSDKEIKATLAAAALRIKCEFDTEGRDRMIEEVVRRIGKNKYFLCSACRVLSFNPMHILLHLADMPHITTFQTLVLGLDTDQIGEVIGALVRDAVLQYVIDEKRRESQTFIPIFTPADLLHLKPDPKFLESVIERNSRTILTTEMRAQMSTRLDLVVDGMVENLSKNGLGVKLMRELDANIGEGQTRCHLCSIMTGNREQYYTHFGTYRHVSQGAVTDFLTLLINYTKNNSR